ncbi:MAG: amidohydrolase family protein [Bacteroidota bacterium]
MFDTIIRNAQIYSGRKEAPRKTHLAIQGDRIAEIGDHLASAEAKNWIEAEGCFLGPGFIDPHASTGFGYFFPRAADHKLYQGITTEIFGNCGTSPAPIGDGLIKTMERLSEEIGFPFTWRTTTEYFKAIQDKLQFNIGTLVGHSTLRGGFLDDWHQVSDVAMGRMKEALAQAMDEGALGMSSGLIYAPGCFAELDELVQLVKIVREKGGVYASHIRNERDQIEDAIEEALTIGQQAEIPVLISHLKAAEKNNWGKIPKVLERIERYRRETGLAARVDVYPYTAVSTKLRAFIPKHFLGNGIAELPKLLQQSGATQEIAAYLALKGYDLNQMLIISDNLPAYYGQTVGQLADSRGMSEAEIISEMLQASTEVWVVYHCIDERDMDQAVLWDDAMICTDSWSYPINAPKTIGQPHPRSYGAFTTFLQRYVLEQKSLSWEEAFYKASYLPAQFFQLLDRGEIRPGALADLVLFDPQRVRANATYLNPKQLSDGVEYLWVNGQVIIQERKVVDASPGLVLRPNRLSVNV